MQVSKQQYALEGAVVVVTGAGTGIGRTIASGFLEQGANLVVAGRSVEPLESLLAEHENVPAIAVTADLATEEGCDQLIARTIERFGRIDVLVCNAGAFTPGELHETSTAEWRSMMGINVDSVFFLARAATPHLITSRGTLIAVSSVSGLRADWRQAAYNATKGAVNTLVRSLALDLGAHGVRVNAVAPAYTLTAMAPFHDEVGLRPYVDRFPLRRPGRTEDVARAVLFLASPDAGFITGVVLPVDGGLTAATGHPHLTQTDQENH